MAGTVNKHNISKLSTGRASKHRRVTVYPSQGHLEPEAILGTPGAPRQKLHGAV